MSNCKSKYTIEFKRPKLLLVWVSKSQKWTIDIQIIDMDPKSDNFCFGGQIRNLSRLVSLEGHNIFALIYR